MKKWVILIILFLIILIINNLFWIYVVIDTGVTQTYQQDSLNEQKHIINSLGELIVKGSQGYTQKDILHLLRQSNPKAFIVEEDNKIFYEGIAFIFEDNRLVRVSMNY